MKMGGANLVLVAGKDKAQIIHRRRDVSVKDLDAALTALKNAGIKVDNSDAAILISIPAGAFNIVTGEAASLAKTLAEHDGVDAMWFAGEAETAKTVEIASAGNMKSTWTLAGPARLEPGARARVLAPGVPNQDNLDALRGVGRRRLIAKP